MPGIYGTGSSIRPVTNLARQRIFALLKDQRGVTNIRNTLRSEGLKISNQGVTEVVSEARRILSQPESLAELNYSDIPEPLDVGMFFGRTYEYWGEIALGLYDDVLDEVVETDRFPVRFSDDRLLSIGEITDVLNEMGDQIASKGGRTSDPLLAENLTVIDVNVTSVQRSSS